MNDSDLVEFRDRDPNISREWGRKENGTEISRIQFGYDSMERQEKFFRSLCETEEEWEKYMRYRKEWHRRSYEFDSGDIPLSVSCELVGSCNLDCSMCYTRTKSFQESVIGGQQMLPWIIVKNIIDECAELGVPSMLFSWRGESSLYRSKDKDGNIKTFPDVLSYAKKRGILEITSLTNGHFVGKKMASEIIKAEPSWISFSVDGMEENYNKIRTPGNKVGTNYNAFQMVVNNIKNIVQERNRLGKKRPQIRSNTIFPAISDYHKEYQKFMADIGVDWITVNEMYDVRKDKMKEDDIKKSWRCQYPFQRLIISCNGIILPCTGAYEEPEELVLGRYIGSSPKEIRKDGKTVIIDYEQMNINDAWRSKKINWLRKKQKELKRCDIETCKYCVNGAVKHDVKWIPDDWNLDNMDWDNSNNIG
jgi:MoaA/NifB/PqqE/SkfB family radical SAM enzyme